MLTQALNSKVVSQRKRKRPFLSLRFKLLFGFTLTFSCVFAGAYYWFYRYSTSTALSRIKEELIWTLEGASAEIDGDALLTLKKEAKPREDGYTDDPRYWEHVRFLASLKAINPEVLAYTYLPGDSPNEVIFIGSSSALQDPPFGAKFLERFVSSGDENSLISGLEKLSIYLEPYTDEFGYWVSGWIPVKNAKGENVGGLGIDYRADYVIRVQQGIRDSILVAFVSTYGGLFILVFIFSSLFSRPLQVLAKAAEDVQKEDYDSYIQQLKQLEPRKGLPSLLPTDEISTLTDIFDLMVQDVRSREIKLKQQVAELKIEIDEVKRQNQVKEIIDTDFFQSLQEKARRYRNRISAEQKIPKSEEP
ncbi:hypothetical protein L1047_14275 [Synechococcus sp. Nb3U1]|uniref:hypothetical protein n=1 Tax=Synechococcus sp. Nb3U1 TaxID=1914529 RepID=UPI001F320CF4|nr:hypothetical protein [Synechococcus sp. Nb3U1]MCF2972361.1 hypothetical protein [Synechococcus sp. Nb3U1]